MSDYFMNLGSKAAIKTRDVFDREVNANSLIEYFDKTPGHIESNIEPIRVIYDRWFKLLTCGYNVVALGTGSKFRFLETFSSAYLQSQKQTSSKKSGKKSKRASNLKIKIFRLHGFTPISQENFNHAVMNILESRKVTDDDVNQLIEDLRETETHHVFLLHSFDLLYKECRSICDLIFQLYDRDAKHVHLLLSVDNILMMKPLMKLRLRLRLIFQNIPYGESFFHERTRAVCVIDSNDKNGTKPMDLLQGRLSLQSLKDVYQALQETCQKVMVYIMKHQLEQAERLAALEEAKANEPAKKKSRASTTQTSATARSKSSHVPSTLNINVLLKTVVVMTRAAVLRNHLGELKDHNIIDTDESGNHIECLIGPGTCKKFLEYVDSQAAIV